MFVVFLMYEVCSQLNKSYFNRSTESSICSSLLTSAKEETIFALALCDGRQSEVYDKAAG